MNCKCGHCKAEFWTNEKLKSSTIQNPKLNN